MTEVQEILEYLTQLRVHNNREWFQENRAWYDRVRGGFERMVEAAITQMAVFDEELRHLTAKECLFRIYRDVRFSPDKSPYKTHFGAYLAAPGGRKSVRSGYYLHLEPGASCLSVGVWCPEPDLLKSLRQSVYDNIDELEDILHEPDFARYYKDFYEDGKLKTVPRGFPKDFPQADLLKLKHYVVEHPLEDALLASDRFVDEVVRLFRVACPFNRFLNYTVDEWRND